MPNKLIVSSPYDDKQISELALEDWSEIDQFLAKAADLAQDPDNCLPVSERIAILERCIKIFEDRAEEYALKAAEEGGKPLIDSRVEISRGIQGVEIAIRTLQENEGEIIRMGTGASSANRFAFTFREPIGVVAAISAFNHPFNLIIHQVIPAVATGCPVIVKPALTTPLSCINVVDTLYEAGLPKEWCKVAICEDSVSEKIVTDTRVSFFSFIGSGRVGWYLRSKLAPGTRCALEHGGAAPVIIEPDADIDAALPLLSKGGFYHAGQVCVSVQRVFVHESICEKFSEGLTAHAKNLAVGDPMVETTDVGPLILNREVDRVTAWVKEAVDGEAQLLAGGEQLSKSCYSPTVLLKPPADANVSTKEIFGPVVCVYPYSERSSAIANANNVPFSFQAAVFTKDIDRATEICRKLKAAAVMVNDHTAFRVDWMPFAGYSQSGLGVGGIPYSMEDMAPEKLVVIRSSALP